MLLKLPAFKRAVAEHSNRVTLSELAAAVAMTFLAVGTRFALDPILPPGFPYITFFPCIIITGFVWGIVPATTSAVLCGLAAWYWFIPPVGSFELSPQSTVALVFYALVVAIDLGLLQLALYTAGSQARAQLALVSALQLQKVVSDEIDHRLKNMLASVTGLIGLSQKHASSPAELADQLRDRIGAMSHSVTLLRGAADGEQAGFRDVIVSTLRPLGISVGERLYLDGRNEAVSANAIIPLNLMLYELATNSIKYGALSCESGTISVAWEVIASEGTRDVFRLEWKERDGPTAVPPLKTGFGTALVSRMSRALGGAAEFSFEQMGLTVKIEADCSQILAPS